MFKFRSSIYKKRDGLVSSKLFDQNSFYPAFIADATGATRTIIIESPFIGQRRLIRLLPVLESAVLRGVKVIVNTRNPVVHDGIMQVHSTNGITRLQAIGATVLYTGGHHRKLAIIDDSILYEGSLNILSQNDSCEVMRRIDSVDLTEQMIKFTSLGQWYTKGNNE